MVSFPQISPPTSSMRLPSAPHVLHALPISIFILSPEYLSRCSDIKIIVIHSFPLPCVTSSLFGPNILLSTLFSKNPCPCSCLNVLDQASRTYKTTDIITVLCILEIRFVWSLNTVETSSTIQPTTHPTKPQSAATGKRNLQLPIRPPLF